LPGAAEEELYTVAPVIVTGTRSGAAIRELEQVYPKTEIAVPEALKELPGLDLQTRGPLGAQADISIRGSTYQQILILIDGTRVNDPQTAHHNMDLPVPVLAIEKIEVLKGQASSIYGSDAFGGVINIITRKAQKENILLGFGYGSFNTQNYELGYEKAWGGLSEQLSFQRTVSDGYRYDTGFSNYSFLNNTVYKYAGGQTFIKLGYMDKTFGAYDFYTPGLNFPSKESTRTCFIETGSKNELNTQMTLGLNAHYRRHDDNFMLDLTRPSLFVNEHISYNYGLEAQGTYKFDKNNLLIFGGSLEQEEIYSSSLGIHHRPRQALFTELSGEDSKEIKIDTGLRFENSAWGPVLAPALAFRYVLCRELILAASAGYSFRSPSFTELYYSDGVSFGDPALKPETAISYDLGINYFCCNELSAKLSLYARDETNLIDWVGATPAGKWYAQNIGKASVYGIEGGLKANLVFVELTAGASFIYAKKELDYYSKYALLYPAAQASCSFKGPELLEITPELEILYKRKAGVNDYTLLNLKLLREAGGVTIYIEGQNLLNAAYEEIKGIPQPGLTFSSGIKLRL